jgi:hypothetical protein
VFEKSVCSAKNKEVAVTVVNKRETVRAYQKNKKYSLKPPKAGTRQINF